MYQGKHTKPRSVRRVKQKLAMLASILLIMTAGLGATLAYLIDESTDVRNEFGTAKVPPIIVESFDDNKVKENVKVENDGNTDAYIRAAIVATWKDDKGNIAPTAPARCQISGCDHKECGGDYEMTIGEGWTLGQDDGFYYWKGAVAAGAPTGTLIVKAKQVRPNDNYQLVIDVLAQTIQANPEQAVLDAWGANAAARVK